MEAHSAPKKRNRARFRRRKSVQGFTLLQVMATLGIVTVLMLTMTQFAGYSNKTFLGARTLASRDQLSTNLGRIAQSPLALQASTSFSGGNGFIDNSTVPSDALRGCVNGTSPGGCPAANAGVPIPYEFVLTDPNGNAVSGTTGKEALYDINGNFCGNASVTPPSSRCPILVKTSFTATCASGADTCAQASSITVNASISQANGVNLDGLGRVGSAPVSAILGVPLNTGGPASTVNSIAKWISNSSIGSSGVYEVGGNLGIGNSAPNAAVDVQGGVKVGNNPGSCTSANAGEIRYPGGANLEVCAQTGSGFAWAAAGVSASPSPSPSPGSPGSVVIRMNSLANNGPDPYYTYNTSTCAADEMVVGGGVNCKDLTGGSLVDLRLYKSIPDPDNDPPQFWIGTCDTSYLGTYRNDTYVVCMHK